MTETTNGEFELDGPSDGTSGTEHGGDELYALLSELDRFEELLEALDEAGVASRDEAAAQGLPELAAEMDELGVVTRAAAVHRMGELDQAIEATPGEGPNLS